MHFLLQSWQNFMNGINWIMLKRSSGAIVALRGLASGQMVGASKKR